MITKTITLNNKRRPVISIIISSENNADNLKKCLDSFELLKNDSRNVEFIIINNHCDDESKIKSIEYLINRYDDTNLLLYKSRYLLSKSQSRNLGIDFSKGSWLYFVDDTDVATPKFNSFLANFKFNLQNDFYRLPIMDEKNKKKNIGMIKTKYFCDKPSTIILNEEFLERIKLRWESNLTIGETWLFIHKIYLAKNVNYVYLRKHYSVVHNYYVDFKNSSTKTFDEVEQAYLLLFNEKRRNYKQFIIMIFFDYLNSCKDNTEFNQILSKIKKLMKKCKINFFTYWSLGPVLFFKTLKFKWKTLF